MKYATASTHEAGVAVYLEKSMWLPVAVLGIMSAGAPSVILDPATPASRLEAICTKAEAQVVVTTRDLCGRLPGTFFAHVVFVDELVTSTCFAPPTDLPRIDPRSAAYIVFTSGSTGEPKGVIVEHVALCTQIYGQTHRMRLGNESRCLQFAGLSFDMVYLEILTALMHGGCICLPSRHDIMNDCVAAINRFQANHLWLTNSAAKALNPSRLIHKLRSLSVGAEMVTEDVYQKWSPCTDLLVETYGPAETTLINTISPPRSHFDWPGNVGSGFSSVMWIADFHNQNRLLPVGARGQILIEGPLLSRGYLKDPQMTRDRFIEDPDWTSDVTEAETGTPAHVLHRRRLVD